MTTLATNQCLDRANALLRARVIFLGAFSFVLSLKWLHVFFLSFLFFAHVRHTINLKTYK
jgi:hypothetical protein